MLSLENSTSKASWSLLLRAHCALKLLVSGLVVFATARNETALSELLNSGIKTFALDVTNEEHIIRVRDQVAEITGGKLDILVNNA